MRGDIIREKNLFSFSIILIVSLSSALLWLTYQALRRPGWELLTGQIEIRFAHWQLERGARDAFDLLAGEYESINPKLRVVQIPVPEKIFPFWFKARLFAGDPPDIVQLGLGTTPEILARSFYPLGGIVDRPNRHNAGTPLAGVPFRETFFDGMLGGFNPSLIEYYGVPLSVYTNRIIVNLDLLRQITQKEEIPQTFDQLLQIFDSVQKFNTHSSTKVSPIVVYRSHGVHILQSLFGSQTQRMLREVYPPGFFQARPWLNPLLFARGKWALTSEPVLNGFELMQLLGRNLAPGFLQLSREDSTFQFLQKRALMIATGSWDAKSILELADFRLGVFCLPFPEPNESRFGRNTLGPLSEAGTTTGLSLGVTRSSLNPEIAVDFLLFAASQKGNQFFVNRSGMLPSIVGVKPPEFTEKFLMREKGYTQGIVIADRTQPDAIRVLSSQLHQLLKPDSSIHQFASSLRKPLLTAYATDARRSLQSRQTPILRTEVQIAAVIFLGRMEPAAEILEEKTDLLLAALGAQYRSKALQESALRAVQSLLRQKTAEIGESEQKFSSLLVVPQTTSQHPPYSSAQQNNRIYLSKKFFQ